MQCKKMPEILSDNEHSWTLPDYLNVLCLSMNSLNNLDQEGAIPKRVTDDSRPRVFSVLCHELFPFSCGQARGCTRDWNNPEKARSHVDEDHVPQYSHEEGQRKPARGHQGVENKDVDNHRRQHCHRQRVRNG